jgi:hypothetical protein
VDTRSPVPTTPSRTREHRTPLPASKADTSLPGSVGTQRKKGGSNLPGGPLVRLASPFPEQGGTYIYTPTLAHVTYCRFGDVLCCWAAPLHRFLLVLRVLHLHGLASSQQFGT